MAGKTGTGKSTVAQWFVNKKKFYRIDMDAVGHEIMDNSRTAYQQLRENLPEIFTDDKYINRKNIARIVFCDREKLQLLNKALHPEMARCIRSIIRQHDNEDIIIDGALLYEFALHESCDYVLHITSTFKQAQKRSPLEADIFENIWQYQSFISESRDKRSIIIENTGTIEELYSQLDRISVNIFKL